MFYENEISLIRKRKKPSRKNFRTALVFHNIYLKFCFVTDVFFFVIHIQIIEYAV
jgi:hypothetical protein